MDMFSMPGHSYAGPLPKMTQEERHVSEQLTDHVEYLAGKLGERNIWHHQNLQAAARYIEQGFKRLGYSVSEQVYTVNQVLVKNIIAEKLGSSQLDEIMIVGAHYDSVKGAPGADDNASGTAGILELARLLAKVPLKRTLRFVAFVNEEPPFFYTKKMGSDRYAREVKKKQENIVAMFSIESIGYYLDEPHSQRYPFPFSFFYPSTGNYIGFVANLGSRALVKHAVGVFRSQTKFPSEGIFAPGWFTGVGWSDQLSFWRQGYPAIMITDTALFRNPNYHTQRDLPKTLDYDRTARVIEGLARVIEHLANKKVL